MNGLEDAVQYVRRSHVLLQKTGSRDKLKQHNLYDNSIQVCANEPFIFENSEDCDILYDTQ